MLNTLIMPAKNMISVRTKSDMPSTPFEMTFGSPCSEAINRIVDRSLQILGGTGITRDTVVERIFRDVRAFRIYDGPSEVHRWSIGRRIVEGDKKAKG